MNVPFMVFFSNRNVRGSDDRSRRGRANAEGKDAMKDPPLAVRDVLSMPARELLSIPARELLELPVLLEDVREVAEESVWKVIAPRGVVVLVSPEDQAEPVGRLRGMQMVEVELAVGPWLKLKKADGWVRAQGGTRGELACWG